MKKNKKKLYFPSRLNKDVLNHCRTAAKSDLAFTMINSVGNMPDEKFRLVTFLLETVAIGALCLIGIVGNVLSIVVLRFDKTSTATSFLLQALACTDVLLLLDSLVYLCPRGLFLYYEDSAWIIAYFRYYWRSVPYLWSVGMLSQTAVNWLVVLVTLERYLVVCRPLNAKRISNAGLAKFAVFLTVVLAVLFNAPRVFEWDSKAVHFETPICVESSPMNETHFFEECETITSEADGENSSEVIIFTHDGYLRKQPLYNYLYRIVLYALCVALGPFVLLVGVNVKLIAALRQADEERVRMSSHHFFATAKGNRTPSDDALGTPVQSRVLRRRRRRANLFVNQRHYTRLVVILVSTFIVCQMPAMLNQIFIAVAFDGSISDQSTASFNTTTDPGRTESDKSSVNYFLMYSSFVSNLLVVLNSSANFLLYCAFGKKFRELVKLMLLYHCDRQQMNGVLRSVSSTPLAASSKSLPGAYALVALQTDMETQEQATHSGASFHLSFTKRRLPLRALFLRRNGVSTDSAYKQ